MKILELKQNIFKENEVTADKIRDELKKQKKLMINVMSSPGSGRQQHYFVPLKDYKILLV